MIVPVLVVNRTLEKALSNGADFAEIFIEDSYSGKLSVLSSQPKVVTVARLHGAGIRVHYGTEEIYVTTSDLTEKGLLDAAERAASAISRAEAKLKKIDLSEEPVQNYDAFQIYGKMPWEIDHAEKLRYLLSLDKQARMKNSQVTQVEPMILEKVQRIQVANSQGIHKTDQRTNYRIFLDVQAQDAGKTETFAVNRFSTKNSQFYQELDPTALVDEAVNGVNTLLQADYSPAGEMPVIIDNGFGGVIFHEACGHGLETTSVAPKASVFTGKLGERVGESCLTAIDDGTVDGGWGSLSIDDEGNTTQKTVLIENGILKSYMVDQLGAKKTGYSITGSGRRQSYKFAPTSRMRNTFIAPGTDKLENMISDLDYGIYAKTMGGGSVSPGTGEFNFSVKEAYLVENGKTVKPVKGATLIGKGIETLGRITKVADNLKLSAGTCGSVSGMIPAAVGQPAILVSKILVGGRV
ncbi:MAG: TldD/PmbA family protein [Proteobacteria bacterium]|jgi:TldD protein|nr:TldD/PmbA family protein [Pseudomonadota bacterium]